MDSVLDRLLAMSPAGPAFAAYRDAVWHDAATDAALLQRCRDRLAVLLGVTAAEAGAPRPASEREAAALAFAEQWVIDPHGMTDDDCARLRAHLSDEECAAFTMGLALVEAELRASAFLTTLEGSEAGAAAGRSPASDQEG